MAEPIPGRGRPQELSRELLVRSKKVVERLGGLYPHFDTAGRLGGSIEFKLAEFSSPDPPTTGRERRRQRRAERALQGPITSGDIAALQETLYIFRDQSLAQPEQPPLPTELQDEEVFDQLQVTLFQRKRTLEHEEHREGNLANARILAALLTGAMGLAGGAVALYNENKAAEEQAYIQANLLTENPSAPSYAQWQIAAASPDKKYESDGEYALVNERESIAINQNGTLRDTGIELSHFPTSAGDYIKVIIPFEDPYTLGFRFRIFDWNINTETDLLRTPDESLQTQAYVLSGSSRYVTLRSVDGISRTLLVEHIRGNTFKITPQKVAA